MIDKLNKAQKSRKPSVLSRIFLRYRQSLFDSLSVQILRRI